MIAVSHLLPQHKIKNKKLRHRTTAVFKHISIRAPPGSSTILAYTLRLVALRRYFSVALRLVHSAFINNILLKSRLWDFSLKIRVLFLEESVNIWFAQPGFSEAERE